MDVCILYLILLILNTRPHTRNIIAMSNFLPCQIIADEATTLLTTCALFLVAIWNLLFLTFSILLTKVRTSKREANDQSPMQILHHEFSFTIPIS